MEDELESGSRDDGEGEGKATRAAWQAPRYCLSYGLEEKTASFMFGKGATRCGWRLGGGYPRSKVSGLVFAQNSGRGSRAKFSSSAEAESQAAGQASRRGAPRLSCQLLHGAPSTRLKWQHAREEWSHWSCYSDVAFGYVWHVMEAVFR